MPLWVNAVDFEEQVDGVCNVSIYRQADFRSLRSSGNWFEILERQESGLLRAFHANPQRLAAGRASIILQDHGQSRNHKDHAARDFGDVLIEPPGIVAELARQFAIGHDAETDLVRDKNDRRS